MHLPRLSLLLAVAFATVTAPLAANSAATAPILPEVRRHIDQAQSCLDSGANDMAAAHASVVLVSDDIKVNISFDQAVPDRQRANCMHALHSAFQTWSDALNGDVHFNEVATPAEATISIHFQPNVYMGHEAVAGFVNWKRTINNDGNKVLSKNFTADLQLRTLGLDLTPMPASAMHHEACHELGHVLGLDDSDHVGDLMGPLDVSHPVDKPTTKEVAAVRMIRAEAHKILDQSTTKA